MNRSKVNKKDQIRSNCTKGQKPCVKTLPALRFPDLLKLLPRSFAVFAGHPVEEITVRLIIVLFVATEPVSTLQQCDDSPDSDYADDKCKFHNNILLFAQIGAALLDRSFPYFIIFHQNLSHLAGSFFITVT